MTDFDHKAHPHRNVPTPRRLRGERAAAMYSLIVTAELNDVDPQAWLADVLGRIAGHPARKLEELLPWNWQAGQARHDQAA